MSIPDPITRSAAPDAPANLTNGQYKNITERLSALEQLMGQNMTTSFTQDMVYVKK